MPGAGGAPAVVVVAVAEEALRDAPAAGRAAPLAGFVDRAGPGRAVVVATGVLGAPGGGRADLRSDPGGAAVGTLLGERRGEAGGQAVACLRKGQLVVGRVRRGAGGARLFEVVKLARSLRGARVQVLYFERPRLGARHLPLAPAEPPWLDAALAELNACPPAADARRLAPPAGPLHAVRAAFDPHGGGRTRAGTGAGRHSLVLQELLGLRRSVAGGEGGKGAADGLPERHRAGLARRDSWCGAGLNVALGWAAGYLLWRHAGAAAALFERGAGRFREEVLRAGVAELRGSPIGIKLHAELSGVLGDVTEGCFDRGYALLRAHLKPQEPGLARALGVAFAAGGCSFGLACAHDLARVLLLPVHLPCLLLGAALKAQLACMKGMWNLLRGRWKNLRVTLGRPDAAGSPDDLIAEHIIVGALLLTPLALLLPTTLLHYAFALALHWASTLAGPLALRRGRAALGRLAVYSAGKRLAAPALFPAAYYLAPRVPGGGAGGGEGVGHYDLRCQTAPLAAVAVRN